MGIYIGSVFAIVGIGIILFQNGTTPSFTETIKSMGFWIFIPIIFIITGIFEVIKCIIEARKETKIED
ncbi:MAG: hypothetical protein HFJ51_01625 [Clostridia bacterium]|nr:hypothetical protein [Clostridia bacterium]